LGVAEFVDDVVRVHARLGHHAVVAQVADLHDDVFQVFDLPFECLHCSAEIAFGKGVILAPVPDFHFTLRN